MEALWSRCIKHIFVNRRRLETARALRIAEFNQGSVASRKFLLCLGFKIGMQAKKFCAIRKKKRLQKQLKKAREHMAANNTILDNNSNVPNDEWRH